MIRFEEALLACFHVCGMLLQLLQIGSLVRKLCIFGIKTMVPLPFFRPYSEGKKPMTSHACCCCCCINTFFANFRCRVPNRPQSVRAPLNAFFFARLLVNICHLLLKLRLPLPHPTMPGQCSYLEPPDVFAPRASTDSQHSSTLCPRWALLHFKLCTLIS